MTLALPISPRLDRAVAPRHRRAPPRGRRVLACGRLRARLGEEAGFTLIEMLVTCLLACALFASTLLLLDSSQEIQGRDSEFALTLQEDRAGLARMVRDIRQATTVEEGKASAILFAATIGGEAWQIKYECNVAQSGTTYTQCVRLAAKKGNSLPTTGPTVVKDVVNGSEVFAYNASPATSATAATLKVELPAQGTFHQANSTGYSHKVVLEDAAFIRNLDYAG